jgi:CubicO group peptidase (beta-lactamase class C family)
MRLIPIAALAAFVVAARVLTAQPGDVVVRGVGGARVDSFLTRAAMHGLSGTILVAKRGEVVLYKGYGLADRDRRLMMGPRTPFFIGSLAKQFTATAILRLEAEGKLELDDSLGRFLRDVPRDKRGITIRNLLSHTSGLPYLPSAGLFGRGTRDSVMREMLGERVSFTPGSKYEYSTPGYILLAGVIERASGLTYEQYLRHVMELAKLTSTGFVGERERWSVTPIRSYTDDNAESSLADVPALPRFVGAGSIVSTLGDLYRWYTAVAFGELLPEQQRNELFTPVVPVRPNVESALPWLIIKLPTGTLRQAAGDIGGFNAELRHYVDEDLVVVFASNARVRGRGYREVVMNAVARLSRGEPVVQPPIVAEADEARIDSIVGKFSIPTGGTVEVWRGGDSVMVGAEDQAGIALLAGHDSTAAHRADDVVARTRKLLAGLGVDSVAESFTHACIPADARRSFLRSLRRLLGESPSGVEVIGAAIDSPNEARSYLRLPGAAADNVVAMIWSGGAIVGMEPGLHAAYQLLLHAEPGGKLTAYDLFTNRLVRISLDGPTELAIDAYGVRRRAIR